MPFRFINNYTEKPKNMAMVDRVRAKVFEAETLF
jgi:hypothetical protein